MHPIFSVTLFTGQQLVLEAVQRWLTRPCADASEAQRQRRGLKSLLVMLCKTAATGVLATVLDAAIEFRRRQLLAAATEPEGGPPPAALRFPGLGMLSRAGVASWKARLLLCIDELERRAEAYGIESQHRFSPSKQEADGEAGGGPAGKATCAMPRSLHSRHASCLDLDEAQRSQRLGRTVEQLQELVKHGDTESQRRLDDEVSGLVDLLLGAPPAPAAADAGAPHASHGRSQSVPASLDRLAGRQPGCGCLRACRSRPALACAEDEACAAPGSPRADAAVCQICMDRRTNVQVAGCRHDLCFACARRLCASQDHAVPQCPFCRQPIEGFVPIAAPPPVCGPARAAAAADVVCA